MIIKSYEISKINQNITQLILFYGKNEGLKNEALNILNKDKINILNYEEKEIMQSMDDKFEEARYERSIKQNFAISISSKLSSELTIIQ